MTGRSLGEGEHARDQVSTQCFATELAPFALVGSPKLSTQWVALQGESSGNDIDIGSAENNLRDPLLDRRCYVP
jgi:hypothetical protein